MTLDFDAWRARYDTLSDAEQRQAYDAWFRAYPVQDHADRAGAQRFFAGVPAGATVLEVGGWQGDLAAEILRQRPDLTAWLNVEFCAPAARSPRTEDGRYYVHVPTRFRWWETDVPPSDVVLATHVIEHLKGADLLGLFRALPWSVGQVYLEAPLPETGPARWDGYCGSHILEWGWDAVTGTLAALGFAGVWAEGDCRAFRRVGRA